MPSLAVTDRQRGILRDVLAPFAAKIESVAVFGSRATGKARMNSDIDLVIYGPIAADIGRLRTLFDESGLEIAVDLVAYENISYPPLKAHIDDVALTLFTQDDFKPGRI